MGVTSGRVLQEVGVANGWNLCVWLVSVVVRRYIYYRYPHNNYSFPLLDPLVLTLFLAVSSLFLCLFLNVFLNLFMLFFCNVIIKNC